MTDTATPEETSAADRDAFDKAEEARARDELGLRLQVEQLNKALQGTLLEHCKATCSLEVLRERRHEPSCQAARDALDQSGQDSGRGDASKQHKCQCGHTREHHDKRGDCRQCDCHGLLLWGYSESPEAYCGRCGNPHSAHTGMEKCSLATCICSGCKANRGADPQ